MAQIFPFRALRPAPDHAASISSVPYDVVSTDEARALAEPSPESFLRVTRSELELPDGADPYGAEVYDRARANLERLRASGALVADAEPALYVYRLRMGEHVQSGVAGCFSIDAYENGEIKRHEKTRRDKEDDRTRHIASLRAQTGIVFLTYPASAAIDELVRKVSARAPLYDFVAPGGVAHTVWRAEAAESADLAARFGPVPALYIADGHHRAASAWRARGELGDGRRGTGRELDRFLAVAFPSDQVQVLPYHRIVKDLNGMSPAELAEALNTRFETVEDAPQPSAPGRVSVYLDGSWRTIVLADAGPGATAVDRLDGQRLEDQLLRPLLGIGDLRADKRIDFVGGIRGTGELERLVDSGKAAVAFALYPVSVDDLIAVSDAGQIMPPKSTWFEPKLRDGLLVHEI